MTIETMNPEAFKKACVYDSEGKVLLKESVERLAAQFGISTVGTTAVTAKKEPRYADTTGKPVRDLETGILYASQAKAAKALAPGREVVQGEKPVTTPATTDESEESSDLPTA